MKLEAKTRLSASLITAAPGDAKLLRKTFLQFGRALKAADQKFNKYVRAVYADSDDADDYLLDAGYRLQSWMYGINEAGFNNIPGFTDFVVDPGEGSHDLYGGMGVDFGHDSLYLGYNLDVNDPKKHGVSVSINQKEFKYEWASGKFDLVKYQQMVNKTMDVFEKNGFGGPKK